MDPEPVVIVPHDERSWPRLFEEERRRIEAAIGPWIEEIEHVGSTAVPGLAAKPIIDIMVGAKSLDDSPILVDGLGAMGYEYVPELEEKFPSRRYFRKARDGGRRTHQIHLVERSNAEWWDDHIAFRDHLRTHPGAAKEYEELKRALASRFHKDRDAYTDAKTDFIESSLHQARRSR